MNPPPSLTPRQSKWLRRGAVALLIFVFAGLVIVPWENVGLMLLVPGYPLLLAFFAFGLACLGQRGRAGRWMPVLWGLIGTGLVFAYWIRFRSLVSDPLSYLEWHRRVQPIVLWVVGTYVTVGVFLALWGWVLYVRSMRSVSNGDRCSSP